MLLLPLFGSLWHERAWRRWAILSRTASTASITSAGVMLETRSATAFPVGEGEIPRRDVSTDSTKPLATTRAAIVSGSRPSGSTGLPSGAAAPDGDRDK